MYWGTKVLPYRSLPVPFVRGVRRWTSTTQWSRPTKPRCERSRRAALARAIQAAHAVRRSAESPSEGGRTRLPPAASLKRSDEAFHLLGIHEVILLCQTYTAQTTAKQKTENLPASGDIGDVKKQHTVSQILVIRQIKETRMMECLTSLDL